MASNCWLPKFSWYQEENLAYEIKYQYIYQQRQTRTVTPKTRCIIRKISCSFRVSNTRIISFTLVCDSFADICYWHLIRPDCPDFVGDIGPCWRYFGLAAAVTLAYTTNPETAAWITITSSEPMKQYIGLDGELIRRVYTQLLNSCVSITGPMATDQYARTEHPWTDVKRSKPEQRGLNQNRPALSRGSR